MFKTFKAFIILTLIFVLPIFITACAGSSINSSSSIIGEIKDFDGENPTSGLVVLIKDGSEIARMYSNAHWEGDDKLVGGGFEFNNLSAGKYQIEIYKLGYKTFNTFVTLEEGQTKIVQDIVLETKEPFSTNEYYILHYYIFNTEYDTVDDSLLRKALNLAIDRQNIVNIGYGNQAAHRILLPQTYGYTDNILVSYNLSEAQNILNSNGYKNIEFTIHYYSTPLTDKLLNATEIDWEVLDAIQNVNLVPFKDESGYDGSQYDVFKTGWILDNPDPLFLLTGINDIVDFPQKAIDYLNQAKLLLDDESSALEYIYNAEKELIEDGTIIPLVYNKVIK